MDTYRGDDKRGMGIFLTITSSVVSLAYMLSLCYLSFIGAGHLGRLYRRYWIQSDDLLHFLAFLLLALLFRVMFFTPLYRKHLRHPKRWAAGMALVLAVFIESVQLVMPTRHATWFDLSLHAAGVCVFLVMDKAIERPIEHLIHTVCEMDCPK